MNSTKGFAGMSLEKRSKIASMGGKAAHAKGTAHRWNSETGRKAGLIGGMKSAQNRDKSPKVPPLQ